MRPAVCDGISFVPRATPNGSTHNHSTVARAVARRKHPRKKSCRPGASEQRRGRARELQNPAADADSRPTEIQKSLAKACPVPNGTKQ
jgi:hypothetical protein